MAETPLLKATPGPYHRRGTFVYAKASCVADCGQYSDHASPAVHQACVDTANLLAASWELYRALALMVEDVELATVFIAGNPTTCDKFLAGARRALAKARGEMT